MGYYENTGAGPHFRADEHEMPAQAACQWVRENTDNTLFFQYQGVTVRVSQDGYVWVLKWDSEGRFYYWDRLSRDHEQEDFQQ